MAVHVERKAPGEHLNRVISRDGTSIAFARVGTGPPIICVDGAFCFRQLGPMPKLAPLLAPHFTVFTYDRRARGESGDTQPYAVERELEDIEALIEEAGGSAHLFGMSSGAALALKAARVLAVDKLALYEPPFMVGKSARELPPDVRVRLESFVSAGRYGDAAKLYLRDVIGLPAVLVAVMRLMPVWSKLRSAARSLLYDLAIMGDFSLPLEELAAVSIPTLVIGGEKSPAMLRDAVCAVAHVIPHARHQLLERQDHNVSEKALAPVLERFFRESLAKGL